MEAELFRADGQTDRHDMMKLMVAFRRLSNAPNEQAKYLVAVNSVRSHPLTCPTRQTACVQAYVIFHGQLSLIC